MILGLIILVLFIVVGILVGQFIVIPYSTYQYVAVAILACLDSIFGALAASTGKNFKMKIFLSGFFFNALFSMFLVYLGEILNVEIYLAAIKILNNYNNIRKDIMKKDDDRRKKYKLKKNVVSNNAIKTDAEVEEEKI